MPHSDYVEHYQPSNKPHEEQQGPRCDFCDTALERIEADYPGAGTTACVLVERTEFSTGKIVTELMCGLCLAFAQEEAEGLASLERQESEAYSRAIS